MYAVTILGAVYTFTQNTLLSDCFICKCVCTSPHLYETGKSYSLRIALCHEDALNTLLQQDRYIVSSVKHRLL